MLHPFWVTPLLIDGPPEVLSQIFAADVRQFIFCIRPEDRGRGSEWQKIQCAVLAFLAIFSVSNELDTEQISFLSVFFQYLTS